MYSTSYYLGTLQNFSFLVTGGAGFIGSHLANYLIQHEAKSVTVLDNLSNGNIKNIDSLLSKDNFQFIEGDICDLQTCQKACEKVDFVLHQAALGSVPRSLKTPLITHDANVNGTLNMLEAARNAGVRRIVYASSSSVYGDHPTLPKVESTIGEALSPYAVSKRTDELYANVFFKSYGFEAVGLRYFNVFGPKQDPSGPYAAVIPLFAKALLNGKSPIIFGDGEQSRDFTFVGNVIQANIRALFAPTKKVGGEVFNVGNQQRTTINELAKVMGKELNIDITPSYQAPRPGDVQHSLANIEKAKERMEYEPEFSFSEGIRLTAAWYKELFA